MLRSFILFAGLVLALGLAGCPQQAEEPAGEEGTIPGGALQWSSEQSAPAIRSQSRGRDAWP